MAVSVVVPMRGEGDDDGVPCCISRGAGDVDDDGTSPPFAVVYDWLDEVVEAFDMCRESAPSSADEMRILLIGNSAADKLNPPNALLLAVVVLVLMLDDEEARDVCEVPKCEISPVEVADVVAWLLAIESAGDGEGDEGYCSLGRGEDEATTSPKGSSSRGFGRGVSDVSGDPRGEMTMLKLRAGGAEAE